MIKNKELRDLEFTDHDSFVEPPEQPVLSCIAYKADPRKPSEKPSPVHAIDGMEMIVQTKDGFNKCFNEQIPVGADFNPDIIKKTVRKPGIFRSGKYEYEDFKVYQIRCININPVVLNNVDVHLAGEGRDIREIRPHIQLEYEITIDRIAEPEAVARLMGRFNNLMPRNYDSAYDEVRVSNKELIENLFQNDLKTALERSCYTVTSVTTFYEGLNKSLHEILLNSTYAKNLGIRVSSVLVSFSLNSLEQIQAYDTEIRDLIEKKKIMTKGSVAMWRMDIKTQDEIHALMDDGFKGIEISSDEKGSDKKGPAEGTDKKKGPN